MTTAPVRSFGFFATFVIAAVVASSQSKSGPSDFGRRGGHDLRISDKARAVLVQVREKVDGKVTVAQSGDELTHVVDHWSEARWLDEVGAPGASATHHRRTFLQFHRVEGGRVQDPGLEGVCITLAKVDDEVIAEARPPRQVLKSHLAQQRVTAPAVGLWADLPAKLEVGASFPFAGEALLATILHLEGGFEGFKCEMTLDRVDVAASRAFLSGTASFSARLEKTGLPYAAAYSGAVTLELDLVSRTLAQVTYNGTCGIKGRGAAAGRVEGEVTFQATATALAVTDLSSYRTKNPVFRDNTHALGPVRFNLPSCWMQFPIKETGLRAFFDSRIADGAAIEIIRLTKPAGSVDDLLSKFLASARKESPDTKVQKATFPTGEGLTFECSAEDCQRARGFVAPLGRTLVRVRVVGPPTQVRKADSLLKSIQDSLSEDEG